MESTPPRHAPSIAPPSFQHRCSHRLLPITLAILLSAQSLPAKAATPDTFTGQSSNLWSDPTNWTAGTPNSPAFDALLINSAGVATLLDTTESINNLSITLPNTLTLQSATTLSLSGTSLSNTGSILINPSASLFFASNTTLSGAGTIQLLGINATITGNGSTHLATSNSILGQGVITSMLFNNAGTIGASGGLLTIVLTGTSNVVNTGIILSQGGGTLSLVFTNIDNTGGLIESMSGSVITSSGTISGGRIDGSGNSTLTISGLVSNATIQLDDAAVLNMNGTISGGSIAGGLIAFSRNSQFPASTSISSNVSNSGTLTFGSSFSNLQTLTLLSASKTTFNGTLLNSDLIQMNAGTLTLNASATNSLSGSISMGAGAVMTGVSGTPLTNLGFISGAGTLGGGVLTINNSGTITAQGGLLSIQPLSGTSTFTNMGLLTASAGTLVLAPGTYSPGGTIATGVAGDIRLPANFTLNGETVTVNPAGKIDAVNATGVYGGAIAINGGTLGLASYTGTLTGTASFYISGAVLAGSQQFTGIPNFVGSSTITSPSYLGNASTFIVSGGAIIALSDLSVPALLTGGGLFPDGTINYSGPVTLQGGILGPNHTTASVSSNITINGGQLGYGLFTGQWTGSANFSIYMSTLADTASYTGTATLTGNNLVTTSSALSPFGYAIISSGTTTISAPTQSPFQINGGMLQLGPGGSFANNSITLAGGILRINANSAFSNLLSPTTASGSIALDISNYTAGADDAIDFSSLPPGVSLTLGSTSTGSIAAGVSLAPDSLSHTLFFGGAGLNGTLTVNSNIVDINSVPTNVTILGPSTTIFAGSNSYSGVTTLYSKLFITSPSTLGTGSGIDADGTVIASGGFLATAVGISLGDEKLIVKTGGTLTLNAPAFMPITVLGGNAAMNGDYSGSLSITGGSYTMATASNFSGTAIVNTALFSNSGSITGNLALTGATLSLTNASVTNTAAITLNNSLLKGTGTISTPIQLQGTNNQIGNSTSSLTFTVPLAGNAPWNFGDPKSININSGSETFTMPMHVPTAGMTLNSGNLYFNDIFTNDGPTAINTGWVYFSGASNTFNGPVVIPEGYNGANFLNATFNGGFNGNAYFIFSGTTIFNGPAVVEGPTAVNNPIQKQWLQFQGPVAFNGPTTLAGWIAFPSDLSVTQLSINGLKSIGGHMLSSPNPVSLQGAISMTLSAPQLNIFADWTQLTDLGPGGPINFSFGTVEAIGGARPLGNPTNPVTFAARNAVMYFQGGVISNPITLENSTGVLDLGALATATGSGVILSGPIYLGADHAIIGGNNTAIEFSGNVSGGGLTVEHGGLVIGSSTMTYTGPTIIDNGYLSFDTAGQLSSTSSLKLITSQFSVSAGNIRNSLPIAISNSRINASGTLALGPLTLLGGFNTIADDSNTATALQITSLSRNLGSTLDYTFGIATASVSFSSPPSLVNGILGGWATIGESNFAGLSGSTLSTAPTVSNLLTAPPTSNVEISTFSGALPSNLSVNSLVLNNTAQYTLDLGSHILSLTSGGLLFNRTTGTGITQIINGTLTTSPGQPELFLHSFGINGGTGPQNSQDPAANISASITDNGTNPVALVISGIQTVQLSGTNSYSGGTYIASGELLDPNSAAFPAHTLVDISNGVISLGNFESSETYFLSSLTLRPGSSITLGNNASLDADLYSVYGEVNIHAYFIGNGVLTKLGEGSTTLNLSPSLKGGIPFGGQIDITNGSLIAPLGTNVLGTGPISVSQGSYLVNDAGTLTNSIATSGDLSGSIQNKVTLPVFAGSITATGTATITTFDTLNTQMTTGLFVGGFTPIALLFTGSVNVQPGASLTKIDSGTLTFSALITNSGSIDLGTGVTNAAAISGTGLLNLGAGGTLTSDAITVSTLTISGTTTVRSNSLLNSSTVTSKVNSLLIASDTANQFTAKLDLTNNAFILESTDPTDKQTKFTTLLTEIQSGQSTGSSGPWTGTGLTSSTVANDAATQTSHSYRTTLAIFDNAAFAAPFTTFEGQPVDANSLLITRALVGDGNFDNTINNADLVILFNHSGASGVTQSSGDYDGNGTVNNADLVALFNDFGQSLPAGLSLSPATGASQSSPVPEPTSLALLLLTTPFLHRRRTRLPLPPDSA